MALAFECRKVRFDSTSGKRQNEPGFVYFDGQVTNAECAVRGYNIKFTNSDRPLHEIEIDINRVSWHGNSVKFDIDFALRDASGTFDDPYAGFVEVLVIADVV